MSAEPVLRLTGLVAGYGGVPVVHGIDLEVAPGEVVTLLGSNGAGKTTTLLAVSGLVDRLAGTVEVAGVNVSGGWRMARLGVAHVPEDRGLFYDLTAAENLRLGRPGGRRGKRAGTVPDEQLLAWFPALERVLDRKAGLLSGGEQQMLALARAMAGRPKLLLVDELSLGLAPLLVEGLLPVVRSIAEETGTGVLLVEQHVALVLAVADRAYLLREGRVAFAGRASELAAQRSLLEAGYLGEG